jgi:hypothetical protein
LPLGSLIQFFTLTHSRSQDGVDHRAGLGSRQLYRFIDRSMFRRTEAQKLVESQPHDITDFSVNL